MPGVIYIQSVPPLFTVKKLRELMVRFGELGRVFLQAEKRGPHRRKQYTEGWVEFKSKRVAKETARMLNGQLVGGKRRSAAYDSIWTMKYLHGFKWDHLMEQLAYERRIEQQRLRTEIVVEKRKAEHFSNQVEKGERLKQLEERILKKSGLWERYQLQHRQRQVVQEEKREQSRRLNNDAGFLKMIFGQDDNAGDAVAANSDGQAETKVANVESGSETEQDGNMETDKNVKKKETNKQQKQRARNSSAGNNKPLALGRQRRRRRRKDTDGES